MYKPVLSIDVSKSKSFAAAFLNYQEPYLKPFSFKHSQDDVGLLVRHLQSLEMKTGVKPDVVLEATGNYSKPISGFFEKSGYNVVVLNPLLTHQQKAKSIRKVKTDPIDANRIAQVYYLNNCKANNPLTECIADLRNLCRQYAAFNKLYTETQLHMQNVLDLVFPNYASVFSHICCKSSIRLLSEYSSPSAVLTADRNHLVEIIKSAAGTHSLQWVQNKVDRLLIAAGESLPNQQAQQSNARVLRDYIRILLTHQDVLADLRAEMVSQASLSPVFNLLRSIPGVGELTAITILAEIGDVNLFPTSKQLVAFAGLDPSVFESGKFKASNNRISKRGSAYLRKALYQAVIVGITCHSGKPVNPALQAFYTKKIAEGKPGKVAMIACCSKLLRIIYGVWRSGAPFANVR